MKLLNISDTINYNILDLDNTFIEYYCNDLIHLDKINEIIFLTIKIYQKTLKEPNIIRNIICISTYQRVLLINIKNIKNKSSRIVYDNIIKYNKTILLQFSFHNNKGLVKLNKKEIYN